LLAEQAGSSVCVALARHLATLLCNCPKQATKGNNSTYKARQCGAFPPWSTMLVFERLDFRSKMMGFELMKGFGRTSVLIAKSSRGQR
jgi:hypothetical protein